MLHNALRIGLLGWCCLMLSSTASQAQVESSNGIKSFTVGQWTILTDLPIDQELESWPNLLDQAVVSWCQKWSIDPKSAKSWNLTIHCIGDRALFQRAGLLEGVPAFEDGFQLADRVYLVDQPSTYYRRHLLLHELTHWIMYRAFGGGGSPWFMEGMAEVEGTHQLNNGALTLAVIPNDPKEVPHWGRFKRLSDSITRSGVPKFKHIVFYGNDRQDRMDRYCWSWAGCVFLRNHPLYFPYLEKASAKPLDYSMKLSQQLESSLLDRWDWVERDWKLFVDEFNFGFQPKLNLLSMEQATQGLPSQSRIDLTMQVDTVQSWQLAKTFFKQGQRIRIDADGTYVVKVENQDNWESSAEGITYQYHRHLPMGKLIGGFVSTDIEKPLEVIPLGKQRQFTASSDGWLLLRINEPVGQRQDNSGQLSVRIHVGD